MAVLDKRLRTSWTVGGRVRSESETADKRSDSLIADSLARPPTEPSFGQARGSRGNVYCSTEEQCRGCPQKKLCTSGLSRECIRLEHAADHD
jgi:hypothetical protein